MGVRQKSCQIWSKNIPARRWRTTLTAGALSRAKYHRQSAVASPFYVIKSEFTAIIEPAPEGGFWAICPKILLVTHLSGGVFLVFARSQHFCTRDHFFDLGRTVYWHNFYPRIFCLKNSEYLIRKSLPDSRYARKIEHDDFEAVKTN